MDMVDLLLHRYGVGISFDFGILGIGTEQTTALEVVPHGYGRPPLTSIWCWYLF